MLNVKIPEDTHTCEVGDKALPLLEIAVRSYPILDKSGMGLNAPFAVGVENEDMARKVSDVISGFGSPEIIPLGLPKKEFENRIAEADYEVIPIACNSRGEKCKSNLEILANAMASKRFKEKRFYSLPVVICWDGILKELGEYLSGKWMINGKKIAKQTVDSEEAARNLIKGLLDNLQIIEYKLQSLSKSDTGVGFLRGAGEVYKVLKEQEEGVNANSCTWAGIERTVRDLEEGWEIADDYSVWMELLRNNILDAAKSLTGIVNRNKVSEKEEKVLWLRPLYDDSFYYLTPDFFTRMCKNISFVSEIELKQAMHDAGILAVEGVKRIYFDVKVPIRTGSGVKIEKRRLRVVRSWLDLPGELSWEEQIKENIRRLTR